MKVKALAPWMGGKRGMAPEIIKLLGPHRVYWELCCGSMPVLLTKPPAAMETVVDLHADLINLARVVQDRSLGPMLYRRLRRVICSNASHRSAQERMEVDFPVGWISSSGRHFFQANLERAFDYFIVCWQGMNGTAGTKITNQTFCVRYTGNGGHSARRWASAVDSIPAWRRRLRHVTILDADALEVVKRIDDAEGTSIYCDPPYVEKGSPYLHDPDNLPGRWGWLRWHVALCRLLSRFHKARVVVSYYDHTYIRRLYGKRGWSIIESTRTKSIVNQGRRDSGGSVAAPEILLVNHTISRPEAGLFQEHDHES